MRTTFYKDQNNDIGDRILTATADVTELKENKQIENVKVVDKPIQEEKRFNEPSKKRKVIIVKTSPYKKKKGATIF